jgi:hypothetical protein
MCVILWYTTRPQIPESYCLVWVPIQRKDFPDKRRNHLTSRQGVLVYGVEREATERPGRSILQGEKNNFCIGTHIPYLYLPYPPIQPCRRSLVRLMEIITSTHTDIFT